PPLRFSPCSHTRNPPAAHFEIIDRALLDLREDADLRKPHRCSRGMLEAKVLHVHVDLTKLGEKSSELTRSIVDHDDDLGKSTVLSVLARQPRHAHIARGNRISDTSSRSGRLRFAQRFDHLIEVVPKRSKDFRYRTGIRPEDLDPQF